MKDKAFFIFFVTYFFVSAGHAQYDTMNMVVRWNALDPNTVDTLSYGTPYYFQPYEDFDDFVEIGIGNILPGLGYMEQYVPDTPTTIYGIAATATYGRECRGNAYFFLADKDQAGNWRYLDTVERYGYHVISTFCYPDTMSSGRNRMYIIPSYEYYFEQPHIMSDTFYVGIFTDDYWTHIDSMSIYGYCGYANSPGWSSYHYWPRRGGWFRIDQPYDDLFGGYIFGKVGLYPIIQPDRLLCGGPGGLRLVERGSDYASIAWGGNRPFDDLYSGRYQVSAGPLYTPPDSNNIITVSDSTAVVTGLDSGIYLAAWVRSECDHQCPNHDTLLWSQWSGPLVFYVGTYAPGEASVQTPLAADISLSPNPATDVVRVESGERKVESYEVVDMQGRIILRQQLPAPVSSLLIDTSPLPSGSYLLRLYTREEIVNKRLSLTP